MRYVRIGTQYEPGLYEPGLQELAVEFLKWQVRESTWKRFPAVIKQEAFAFIQGSGLETVIELFGLPMEPKNFRNAFTQCLTQQSAWSSATILAISS